MCKKGIFKKAKTYTLKQFKLRKEKKCLLETKEGATKETKAWPATPASMPSNLRTLSA